MGSFKKKGCLNEKFSILWWKDIKEATKLSGSDSRYLSGGMTLVPSLKQRLATPKRIIGLKKIKKLSGIKVSKKSVIIGATTTHKEVEFSKEIEKARITPFLEEQWKNIQRCKLCFSSCRKRRYCTVNRKST